MLQILRNKAQSTFIQIIVVIIALVFIFWGVGANLGGDRQAALTVNDESITFEEFQRAYDGAYQRLSDQFGGNVPKGLAETFGIKQQVINQLIQTTLLRQGAEKMGLTVSVKEISRIIEQMVQFQQNDQFSMEQYKAVLAANRMAPTKFEDTMRRDRLSQVAAREISNFAGIVTDFEIEQIYSKENEKISVKYSKIQPGHFADKVTLDDTVLKQWFETVKEEYKSEPKVKMKYLAFTFENVGSKIEIDQAKIEEYYQNNISRFKVAEERHARHILFKAGDTDSEEFHAEQSAKAEEVLKLAQEGVDFSSLAMEHSEGPSKTSGGDLGFFGAGQMVPAFDTAVFSMQPGDISNLVKTQFGYHIIKLEEIKEAATTSLEEATDEITSTLQQKEAENLAFQVANNAYEKIIGAGSLANYAETNPDMTILESDFFTRSDAPVELAQDAAFLDKAFELNKGELSSLIKGRTGYAILFAEDFMEPEIPTFESKKEILVKDYRAAQSREMAEAAADKMLQDLREGKDLNTLATIVGVPVLETALLNRNGQNPSSTFPAALLDAAFLLSSSAPLPEKPGKVGDDFFVYSFVERQIPAMPEDSEEIEKYRQQLTQTKQQQVLSAWLRNQEMNATITRHPSL